MRPRSSGRVGATALAALTLLACAPAPRAAPLRTAHAVSAVVLANRCLSLGPANAKLAERAMNQLVDGCGSFTGGSARFTATLLPGGAIQFASGDAGAPSQSVPMCVVSHPLTHGVHLTKACELDVVLEESSMVLPTGKDAGSG